MIFICMRKDRWRTMRTPKEYTDNIKNGIITKQMLSDCIFSVNKRAKNWRDKEHEYRGRYTDDWYGMVDKARENKEMYYSQKETLLNAVNPECIHREKQYKKERVRYYDYEEEYYDLKDKFFHEGEFWDRETEDYVSFGDIMVEFDPSYNYYLFYDLGHGHTFHTPIEFGVDEAIDKLNAYPELEVKEVHAIVTFGKNTNDLLSTQFVGKVLSLIRSGEYTIIDDDIEQESLAS